MKTLLDTARLHIFLLDDKVTVDTRMGRSIEMTLTDFITASNALAHEMDVSEESLSNRVTIEIDQETSDRLRAESESGDDYKPEFER